MNIFSKITLFNSLKKSNQLLIDIDKASNQEQLDKSIKHAIKNAESLFKKLKNQNNVKEMESNPNYEHNTMLLLYKAKFIDSFKEHTDLHQQTPFSIALTSFYSSKTTIEKSFFLFALFLTLADIKREYLSSGFGLEYYLKYDNVLADLSKSFKLLKENVEQFEYVPNIKKESKQYFSYIESLILNIHNMNRDNFTNPLFSTNKTLPFWINEINNGQYNQEENNTDS